jgi:hypothetical protein
MRGDRTAMFHVEFIKYRDWQPEPEVVLRLPEDFKTFDEAISAGKLQNSGVYEGPGFRVVESDLKNARPARIVAHRFRGQN